jgi:hypothetical protein
MKMEGLWGKSGDDKGYYLDVPWRDRKNTKTLK